MKKILCLLLSALMICILAPASGAAALDEAESAAEPAVLPAGVSAVGLDASYSAGISIDRTVYFLGGEFSISYTNSQYDKDWIILVPTRTMTSDSVTPTTPYENYFYVKENGDGIVSFPEDRAWNDDDIISGEYLAVMLQNNGYTQCSNEVYFRAIDRTAYDEANMSLEADRTKCLPGESITLTYENTGSKDWVGLYTPKMQIGIPGQESLAWTYVDNESGISTITIPEDTVPGTYHLVLLQNDDYTQLYAIEITVLSDEASDGPEFYPYNGELDPEYGILIYSHDFEKFSDSKDVTNYNYVNASYIDSVSGFNPTEGGTSQGIVSDPDDDTNHALQLYHIKSEGDVIYHVDFTDTTDGYGKYTLVNDYYNKLAVLKNMYYGWLKIGGDIPWNGNAEFTEMLNTNLNRWYTCESEILADSGTMTAKNLSTGTTVNIDNGKLENLYLGGHVTGEEALLIDNVRLYYLPEGSVQVNCGGDKSVLLATGNNNFVFPEFSQIDPGLTDSESLVYYDKETHDVYAPGDTVNASEVECRVFTVTEVSQTGPTAPGSVTYTPAEGVKPGYADGTLSAAPGEWLTDGVAFYWGGDNGPLDDYTFIGYGVYDEAKNEYVYVMTAGNIIPAGASKIIAYGCNGTVYDLQDGKAELSGNSVSCGIEAQQVQLGEMLYSFDVISDLHTNTNKSHETNILAALDDIKKNNPGTTGVFIAGDTVDHGAPDEYALLGEYFEKHLPDIKTYMTVGNHEFYYNQIEGAADGDFFDENWQRFREFAGWNDGEYYRYEIINGDYFIFLGEEARGTAETPDQSQGTADGYYSPEQREWLKNVLAEAAKTDANAFVFMHQSIENTVSGSFDGQNWDGINDDAEMKAVIESYPNTFLFTGHSHWNLNSKNPFINGGADGASYFNTASAGYLWNDANTNAAGSEGLRVEVYAGYVLVRGRDYINGKWVSNVQALIETGEAPVMLETNSIRFGENEGIRFAALIDIPLKAAAQEYGFIATTLDKLNGKGQNPEDLKLDSVTNPVTVTDGKGSTGSGTTSGGVPFVYGIAYRNDGSIDIVYDSLGTAIPEVESGKNECFTAVLTNITPEHYKDIFVVRSYVKINGVYYYGNTHEASFAQVALKISQDEEAYSGLTDEQKAVVDSIVSSVK